MARSMTLVLLVSVSATATACDTVLGLGQYTFDGSACTGPSFDQSRITPLLLPDGALPPLPDAAPVAEAGPTDAGGG